MFSASVAFIAGLILNYVLSTRWVFRSRRGFAVHVEFALFAGIGLVALVAMENLAKRIDFSTKLADGSVSYPIPAFLAFGVLLAVLAFVAFRGPRPFMGKPGANATGADPAQQRRLTREYPLPTRQPDRSRRL